MVERDPRHTPVLLSPVSELLAPGAGQVVCDLTVGLAGHARMLAQSVGREGVLVGIDVDAGNLVLARQLLQDAPCRVVLKRENFVNFGAVLAEARIGKVDVLFADLGVSSTQLEEPARGFSFRRDGPLDMRMDDRLESRACDLVNGLREQELSDLLYHHSQERFSRRIAKGICRARRDKRITTTSELVKVVCTAIGVSPDSRKSKIHPATRVFQALRIAVNDELGALSGMLAKAPDYLRPGGRVGVIAFHSIEDGLVKRDFRRRKSEGLYELLTKRPVTASAEERMSNPRCRSAKFRVARRTSELGAGQRDQDDVA